MSAGGRVPKDMANGLQSYPFNEINGRAAIKTGRRHLATELGG